MDSQTPVAVCRRCQRPLTYVRSGETLAFFEACDRHPHQQRTVDRADWTQLQPVKVPLAEARQDRVLVAVPLAALRAARGSYGA